MIYFNKKVIIRIKFECIRVAIFAYYMEQVKICSIWQTSHSLAAKCIFPVVECLGCYCGVICCFIHSIKNLLTLSLWSF